MIWAERPEQPNQKIRSQRMLSALQSVNSFDWLLIGGYALVLLLMNSRAWLPLLELVVGSIIHIQDMRNFYAFIITALIAFTLATARIKTSLEIRQAFICFGGIYLMSAIDNFISYHYNYDTSLNQLTTVAVILVNAYLLAHLFSDWRRKNANGITHYCAKLNWRGKIVASHNHKLPEAKR